MSQVTWSSELDIGKNTVLIRFKVNNLLYNGLVPKSIIKDSLFSNINDYRNTFKFWREIKEIYLKKKKQKKGVKFNYLYNDEQLVYKKDLTLEDIYKSIKTK